MTNNKKIVAGLAASAIIALSFGSASAMYGQGHGSGQGNGLGKYVTNEERAKLQSLSGDERVEYMNKLKSKYNISGGQGNGKGRGQGYGRLQRQNQARQSGHNQNPADMIADVEKSDLSETEKEFLINQYGEEKMARDLYSYATEKYPNINTFGNITKSEQKHMETLQVLLDRYDVEAPSDYAKDNELYKTLKAKIDLSEKDAIEVGIMVEKVDIDNIIDDIKATNNDDIKIILSNIGGASYNHLRGFINALNNNGYTTEIDYSDYLTNDEINSRGGGLKSKLAEKLEAEGFSLPEKASSKYIKEKCDRKYGEENEHGEYKEHGKKIEHGKNSVNNELKNKYKKAINSKYGDKIAKISDEKLKIIVKKIDKYLERDISEKNKIVLIALKEIIEEKLNDNELDINELLN